MINAHTSCLPIALVYHIYNTFPILTAAEESLPRGNPAFQLKHGGGLKFFEVQV